MAADNKVGVEFYATTAAAVGEVSNLTASMREQTTAATVAGSAQEQLGKDVAATRVKQLEATEAVRAAKAALDTHNQTLAAFGARSIEAVASAEKLAAAEREAAKAATVAAEALQKTAAEVKAVAAAEDGQLSPATKRAAAQVAKMGDTAQKTAADLQRMELQQKRGSSGFDAMGFASAKLMSVIGPAALGGTLVALAGWIGDAAQGTLQYETAVANLPYATDAARKSTHGLISDQALVAAAANASALGVARTSEEFAGLAQATLKLAKPGQDANALLNEITGALGRGSSESLNNANVILTLAQAQERYAVSLGVSVSSLTDEQKATAFKVEGLKAVIAAADATTVAFDSNAAAVSRLGVTFDNTWDAIERGTVNAAGSLFTAVGGSTAQLRELVDASNAALTTVDAWSPTFTAGSAAIGEWTANLLLGADALEQVQRVTMDAQNLAAFDAANAAEREKRDLLGEEAEFAERQARALSASEKANEAFLDAQAAASVTYGPEEAPKKKKAGKAKKATEFLDPGDVMRARVFDGREDTAIIAAAAPEAAAAGVAESEAAVFERKQLLAEREMELLDLQASREAERIDSIFFGLEVESEAETRRAELQDQRLRLEAEYARAQVRGARTDAQREQAQTRLEEVEHRKRVAGIARAQVDEARLLAQRQRVADAVVDHVTAAGGAVLDATIAAVAGQRGALAQGLSDFAAGQAKEFGLRALGEFARAAISAATYDYPGAAAHAAAGAMSLGVAAAAGGAAAGLSAAAGGAGGSPAGRPAGPAPSGAPGIGPAGGPGPGPTMGGERERLERQDVPISYAEPAAGAVTIEINIGTFVGGKDSARALAAEVAKAAGRHKAQGPRP